MESFDDEFMTYWETNMFLQTEELNGYFDEVMSSYYDSSSPDGGQASSKNIVSERNRRRKLNERLYALRSVVPNITKMDKASIIKDAIEYIRSLEGEEKRIIAEISELETRIPSNYGAINSDCDHEDTTISSNCPKRKRMDSQPSRLLKPCPIQLLELSVSSMGENRMVVSLACCKATDTIIKLCEAFESLKLKVITSTINAFSERVLKTVFLEGDEEEKDVLRVKIETAIAATNNPESPSYEFLNNPIIT